MSTHYHAVVWIDHHEARVFHFNLNDTDSVVLHPKDPTQHIHHKANSIGSGHATEDQAFLERVSVSINDAGSVLIIGPANAKTELVKHIHKHNPGLVDHIAGIETVDHPSNEEIVAYAKTFFKSNDHLRPQIV